MTRIILTFPQHPFGIFAICRDSKLVPHTPAAEITVIQEHPQLMNPFVTAVIGLL